ncbi:MAG TPA: flagellar hook-associated protein FlgL [Steroidobacteraceae bacterium]|nr:flagellar hook-associated protein FlgL [Steroidobacteraceae bacterium]
MRISTLGFQSTASQQMQTLEAAIARTQQQLSTGKKLQTAADNPVGMAQVNELNAQLSASQQYVANGNTATANLQLEAQSLTGATNTLQSARDLAVEANNSALTATQRQDIATQLQQQLQDLIATANQKNAAGDYLFAGNAAQTLPFAQSAAGVAYSGSGQVNQIQISSNQRISAGDTGASVFMNIPAGNGTFTTAAAAANTGSASITPGTVTNVAAWVPDTYQISFSSPAQYQVTNSTGAVVASGSYTDGDTVSFNGVQVTLNGTPAAGDQFTVAPAGTASVFSTLSGLIKTLSTANLSNAQLTTQINGALQQIDGALGNFNSVQASVGARLNAITASQTSAQSLQTTLTANVSSLTDVDYTQATTQLSSEELALQAAQQSYASIASLSLFNYIK